MPAPLPPLSERLRQLIALPSISSVNREFDHSNLAVVELLAEWAGRMGFEYDVQTLPGRLDKANLVARLGSGPGGLVFAGHTDTVPFDEGRWNMDPFGGLVRDNRLYGLGSADMKSFFALVLEALLQVDPGRLREPVYLLATADEESSMAGVLTLVKRGEPRARFAVVGEPTGLRPIRLHKGIISEAIRVTGRSGHSSNPALGRSALEGMHLVMSELLTWRAELQERYRNPMFEVPGPTMNLGRISGGDNPNRICAHCELQIDLRPLPGMSVPELLGQIEERLRHRLEGSGLELQLEALGSGAPPLETPVDSPLVRALEELTGHASGAVAYGTEAPYYRQMGMDAVVIGPGSIDQAHQPDEYLDLGQIKPAVNLFSRLIERFCCP